MIRKIIIDCDNTFSVEGCDVDDGLAIIYTLAQENAEVLGITTTFGNNEIEIVYPNTLKFMKEIKQEKIGVYKGSKNSAENNEAANFLVEMANKHQGELSIIGLGSLTNFYHAWQLDNNFYSKLNQISLMGGISEPLIINGKVLNELNFASNPKAALNLLENGKNLTIATGNTCLDGIFKRDRFEKLKEGNNFENWLYHNSIYWFDREKEVFKNHGIYIWDILAASALLSPELFENIKTIITPDIHSLQSGKLIGNGQGKQITIPKIKNYHHYIEQVYQSFKMYGEGLE